MPYEGIFKVKYIILLKKDTKIYQIYVITHSRGQIKKYQF